MRHKHKDKGPKLERILCEDSEFYIPIRKKRNPKVSKRADADNVALMH